MKKTRSYSKGELPKERKLRVKVSFTLELGDTIKSGYESTSNCGKTEFDVIIPQTSYARLSEIKRGIDNIANEAMERLYESIDSDLRLTDGIDDENMS